LIIRVAYFGQYPQKALSAARFDLRSSIGFRYAARGARRSLLIPLDVAHHSGMISPTVPI
jgi:hypothetical protein